MAKSPTIPQDLARVLANGYAELFPPSYSAMAGNVVAIETDDDGSATWRCVRADCGRVHDWSGTSWLDSCEQCNRRYVLILPGFEQSAAAE